MKIMMKQPHAVMSVSAGDGASLTLLKDIMEGVFDAQAVTKTCLLMCLDASLTRKDGVDKSGLAVLGGKAEPKDITEAIPYLTLLKAIAEGAPNAHAMTKACLSAYPEARGVTKKAVKQLLVLGGEAESKDITEAIAYLTLLKTIAEGAPDAQAVTKACLSACLEQTGHQNKAVIAAATEVALAICTNINPYAMKSLLPIIFSKVPVEKKWPIRELALKCLVSFSVTCPKQLSYSLPELVPEITTCMWDTKKQIKTAATEAMREVLKVI
jgi:elongation factor 3